MARTIGRALEPEKTEAKKAAVETPKAEPEVKNETVAAIKPKATKTK